MTALRGRGEGEDGAGVQRIVKRLGLCCERMLEGLAINDSERRRWSLCASGCMMQTAWGATSI